MPGFGSLGVPPALYSGDQYALVNDATDDADISTTQEVALAQIGSQAPRVTIVNTTNEAAVVCVSYDDTEADFKPLYVGGTAVTAPAGESVSFDCPSPLLLCTFVTPPTSGSLVINR